MARRISVRNAGPRIARKVRQSPAAGRKTASFGIPENIQERIKERAYYLFEKRGHAHGFHEEDWREAETQVKRELNLS